MVAKPFPRKLFSTKDFYTKIFGGRIFDGLIIPPWIIIRERYWLPKKVPSFKKIRPKFFMAPKQFPRKLFSTKYFHKSFLAR